MTDHRALLSTIRRSDQLIAYLRDELSWPIDLYEEEDELYFDFEPEELGIDPANAAKIHEIRRLRPLGVNDPWGIFFIKFEPKKLPVVALRRILSQVALKKRASANSATRAAWSIDDLLFISNYGEGDTRQISFAHFFQNERKKDLPTLKVLGWDNQDTALHLDHVAETLHDKLSWPEDENDLDNWRKKWRSAFTLEHREVIDTSKKLSVKLAELARNIRNRAITVLELETEKGPVTRLMETFKKSLIHDLDSNGFADMYAQTISYGLLSARITKPSGDTADDMVSAMPVTNPFLKELMETFLKVGGRKSNEGNVTGMDFDELGVSDVVDFLNDDAVNIEAVIRDFGDKNPQEDPVIHFFEGFLKEYDSKIRKDRGVFYTPRPVVSFIVRSVDEMLRKEFGLEYGLADTTTWGEMTKRFDHLEIPDGVSPELAFVQILDPATGTGTFLVEVIDLIYKTMTEKWRKEGLMELTFTNLWNDYVPKHLLPRLHGYELMMAPYAIAHMKIGLKLKETDYHFESDERARVFLTNALEPAVTFQMSDLIPALSHEAEVVNSIKRDQRFTVVIGNPPYSVSSQNKSEFIETLLEDYKESVRGALNIQPLSDDYLKFMRLYQALIEESSYGLVGVVTNNVFLDGLMHKGVRESMMNFYSEISIVNLHGNTTIGEKTPSGKKDENVFDIKQGVGISLFSRKSLLNSCVVRSINSYGKRVTKYNFLELSYSVMDFKYLAPTKPHMFFVEKDFSKEHEYSAFIPINKLMPTYSTGVATHRDSFLVDIKPEDLQMRIETFCNLDRTEVPAALGLSDTRDWSITDAKNRVKEFKNEFLRRYAYKPFSRHYIYYDPNLIDRGCSRIGLMRSMFEQNISLIIRKKVTDPDWRHVFVSRDVVDFNFYNYISVVFPLYILEEEENLFDYSNLSPNFSIIEQDRFSMMSRKVQGELGDVSDRKWPEKFFGFFYSILYSPNYRKRYVDFLKIDFPSIPIPKNDRLFKKLSIIGQELISLHLLESKKLDNYITKIENSSELQVEKVSYSDETVWIDRENKQGFHGIPEEVWNFHIGGYQVCEKWLKDRGPKKGNPGRILSNEDIEHYQKIVVALSETIRIMAEIDEVIEQHGGWPGAFQTESNSESLETP